MKYTGMVKSLFRPSDDATLYPFFIPGNAMLSVELGHLAQLLNSSSSRSNSKIQGFTSDSLRLSKQIRDAIYKYGIVDHPTYGKVFACKFVFFCPTINLGVHFVSRRSRRLWIKFNNG